MAALLACYRLYTPVAFSDKIGSMSDLAWATAFECLESSEVQAVPRPPEAKSPITLDYRHAAVTALGRCRRKGSFHDVGHPHFPVQVVSHFQEVAFLSGQSAW